MQGKGKGSAGVASWSMPWCLMIESFDFTLLQPRFILHQIYATLLLVCLRSLSTSLNYYMHPSRMQGFLYCTARMMYCVLVCLFRSQSLLKTFPRLDHESSIVVRPDFCVRITIRAFPARVTDELKQMTSHKFEVRDCADWPADRGQPEKGK
jgi:hypothetical protein